jgi:pimeloyl-ACP methyl ester carboxylesterase
VTELREGRAEANGISIRYLESGPADAAAAILFLHGGTGTAARHWSGQLSDFAGRGYRCVAPDLRGHGGTTNDRDGLDQELMAEDAAGLLHALGLARAHVVGFSVGGVTGLYLALAQPGLVASVTTIGSHMTIDRHVLASNASIEPGRIQIESPDSAAQLRDLHGVVNGPGHWRTLCRWLIETWGRQPDWSDEDLARVSVPALVGRGQWDDRVVQSQVDRMVAAIPGARMFVVPGAGHYFHAAGGGREALDRILVDFLPPPDVAPEGPA